MTQPVSHGYPDYGRYSAETDVELFTVTADVVNPSKDYGPFFCANFQYFALSMTATTSRFRYQLLWSKDNPATTFIAKGGPVAPQGGPSTLIFPVLGTWLTVRVTPSAAPGTHSMYGFIVPTATGLPGSLNTDSLFTSAGFFTIAAGGNATFLFSHMYAGEASVWTHTTATAGIIEISILDLAGTPTIIASSSDSIAGNAKDANYTLMIPPAPIQVQCFNTDVAVKEFAFAISGRPGWGGS